MSKIFEFIRNSAFFKGFAYSSVIFPSEMELNLLHGETKSDFDALRSDWSEVGKDLWAAIRIFEKCEGIPSKNG